MGGNEKIWEKRRGSGRIHNENTRGEERDARGKKRERGVNEESEKRDRIFKDKNEKDG